VTNNCEVNTEILVIVLNVIQRTIHQEVTVALTNFFFPCGLIAQSLFNDTITLYQANNTQELIEVPYSRNDISWSLDLNNKFNNPTANRSISVFRGIRVIQDQKSEDFIVWMRTASFGNFRKLYRIINQPLKGNYSVIITNNFPVYLFGGHKFVVLSTISWLGAKNRSLGILYLIAGGSCLIAALAFLIAWPLFNHYLKPSDGGNYYERH